MIRRAKQDDATILTRVSFASKGHWRYPKEYFSIWKDELTISPDYIERNIVYVYEIGTIVAGYYSIVDLPGDIYVSGIKLPKGFWLEHMFIAPRYIGKGVGKAMFYHLQDRCKKMGINELGILSDPNSRGFYEKMGCRYLHEFPSTIKNRTTPCLVLRIIPPCPHSHDG